jgi:ParB family chromosome partitioning protein
MSAMLNLTGLADAARVQADAARDRSASPGKPPEMSLCDIVADPDNPRLPRHSRTPEEQQKQQELNASVRKRGVKSPISLRPHPTIPGKWMINHGHCRYEAAEEAGLQIIPYFIDLNFDSYDQITENLHRIDLSIWAIAAFIKRRLDAGDTKNQIAEGLGKEGQNYVTEHLALIDAPGCLHQAYANGVQSPRTLYDLRRAYDEFPEQVDFWCASGITITRDAIKALVGGLRHDVDDVVREVSAAGASHVEPSEDGAVPRDGSGLPALASGQPVGSELRHDVISLARMPVWDGEPPLSTRGAKTSQNPARSRRKPGSSSSERDSAEIEVRYKGKLARVDANTRVRILFVEDGTALEVALFEVVFA